MFLVIVEIITVVERDLFSCLNFTNSHHPNAVFLQQRFTVRFAAVIQKSRGVPLYIAVEVMLIIQRENILVVPLTTLKRFTLRNFLANILDDSRARRNWSARKPTESMNC